MSVAIQLRRGTAEQWTTANPIIADGELAIETDTGRFKIGNGSSGYNSLPYGGIKGPTGEDSIHPFFLYSGA
jgi:hypothetical protein